MNSEPAVRVNGERYVMEYTEDGRRIVDLNRADRRAWERSPEAKERARLVALKTERNHG